MNIKNFICTLNHNTGIYLIYNGQEVHDPKKQADLLAQTWENIM